MDAYTEDWTFINPSLSQYHWEDSSSSASSTPRRTSSKLPSTTNSPSLKRPQLRHRHTPEATHLLSLVHAHEPIEVPMPPSLQAKGRRLSERSISQNHQPRQAWYDYNEFGTLEENRTSQSQAQGRRSSPMSESRLSSSSNPVASVLAPHHTFEPAALGDAGVQGAFHWTSTPYGHSTNMPLQRLLIPQQIDNTPPPLSLPSPVVPSSFSQSQ